MGKLWGHKVPHWDSGVDLGIAVGDLINTIDHKLIITKSSYEINCGLVYLSLLGSIWGPDSSR